MKKVPQGLETLISLKWLDLSWNRVLTLVPGSVLPGLTNMQYLDLHFSNVQVKVEDVQDMRMLECFVCCFPDRKSFNDYVIEITAKGWGPKTYLLRCGISELKDESYDDADFLFGEHNQIVIFEDCEALAYSLPRNLAKLHVEGNDQWICLCHCLSMDLNGPSTLNHITIDGCSELLSLCCLTSSCSFCSLSQVSLFSHLKHLVIYSCKKIEYLLTPGPLKLLQNLEFIAVQFCESIKEIFAVRSSDDNGSTTIVALPKLTTLTLIRLLQLKTVCEGITIHVPSNMEPKIFVCPNLNEKGFVQK